jgi:hypothetical protein
VLDHPWSFRQYPQATSKTKRLAQDKLVDAISAGGYFAEDKPISMNAVCGLFGWVHSHPALIVP